MTPTANHLPTLTWQIFQQVHACPVGWAEVDVLCGRVLYALVGQNPCHRLQLLHVDEGVVVAALLLDVDEVAHQQRAILGLSSTGKLLSYRSLMCERFLVCCQQESYLVTAPGCESDFWSVIDRKVTYLILNE